MYVEPRYTMEKLPFFFQPFLTWLTGMPASNQKPLFWWSPNSVIFFTFLKIVSGVAIGWYAMQLPYYGFIPLLLISWIMVTGRMRMFYVVIEHSCTHNNCGKGHTKNKFIGDAISTLLWTATFSDFKQAHKIHHHATREEADPDAQFLIDCGFYAGMSSEDFWKQFIKTSFSPVYHGKYILTRIKSNFSGSGLRTMMTVCYLVATVMLLISTNLLEAWFLLWVFPATILFQISSLINYISEHRWPNTSVDKKNRDTRLSYGRFCGDPIPDIEEYSVRFLYLWLVWWLRVLLIHLPNRTAVLVGDLSQHDLHHKRPSSDWTNASYIRRDDINNSSKESDWKYTNEWGSMVDHLTASISS